MKADLAIYISICLGVPGQCYIECNFNVKLLYTYRFSRDVIFEVFVVNWPSTKFSSLKFHWQTLTCINWSAGYLVILESKIVKMLGF